MTTVPVTVPVTVPGTVSEFVYGFTHASYHDMIITFEGIDASFELTWPQSDGKVYVQRIIIYSNDQFTQDAIEKIITGRIIKFVPFVDHCKWIDVRIEISEFDCLGTFSF